MIQNIYIFIIIYILLYIFYVKKIEKFEILKSSSHHIILKKINKIRPVNTPTTPLTVKYTEVNILKHIILPKFLTYKYNLLTPIQDEGECGSCWAFIIGEVLANRAMILTNGKYRTNLSAQQILNCYYPKNGCNGKKPEDALLWLENTQKILTSATNIPYKQLINDQIYGKCVNVNIGIKVRKGSIRTLTKFIPTTDYDINILNTNILNMKKELFLNGPFYSVITIYDDFYSLLSTSIYEPNKNANIIGGHSILIVGYCDYGIDHRFPNNGYWIAKNTWGSWPSDVYGYFYIKMGYNICGVESRCQTADPNITNNTTNIEILRYTDINKYINYLNTT